MAPIDPTGQSDTAKLLAQLLQQLLQGSGQPALPPPPPPPPPVQPDLSALLAVLLGQLTGKPIALPPPVIDQPPVAKPPPVVVPPTSTASTVVKNAAGGLLGIVGALLGWQNGVIADTTAINAGLGVIAGGALNAYAPLINIGLGFVSRLVQGFRATKAAS